MGLPSSRDRCSAKMLDGTRSDPTKIDGTTDIPYSHLLTLRRNVSGRLDHTFPPIMMSIQFFTEVFEHGHVRGVSCCVRVSFGATTRPLDAGHVEDHNVPKQGRIDLLRPECSTKYLLCNVIQAHCR